MLSHRTDNASLGNTKNKDKIKDQQSKNDYFTIPYVSSISESFLPIADRFGFHMAYSIPNTLNRFIKRGKDKTGPMSQSECVYMINCTNCDASYVGQTKRQLATRIKEHKGDINRKNGSLSVISNHRLENNHEFNWSGTRILDKESSYTKRLVSEMVFIKKQKNGLNKQSDTEFLPDAYLPIIDLLSPS